MENLTKAIQASELAKKHLHLQRLKITQDQKLADEYAKLATQPDPKAIRENRKRADRLRDLGIEELKINHEIELSKAKLKAIEEDASW